jgi:hypothetical protein
MARFLPFSLSNTNPTKEAVTETFLMSMDNIVTHMARLRTEAGISKGYLLRLEEHLRVLHEITHRDNTELTTAHEQVLAELWTQLARQNKSKHKKDDVLTYVCSRTWKGTERKHWHVSM